MAQEPSEWFLYLRKSKGRAGIARQRTTTTAFIEGLGGRITGEYADTDRTAYRLDGRPERPGFDRLLRDLEASPGTGLAAWHADRLTRNGDDTRELARVCREGHHLIVTRAGGTYDLATANGRKRFRDDASDAQYEVDHAVERIMAAKAEAIADGRWLGGRRPFGWQPDPGAPGGLVLDEAEAGAIRRACADVLDGVSLHAIARGWNQAGITTSTGAAWKPTEAGRVLVRPRNWAPPPAKWPAIVDEDTHRAVTALLADPSRKTSPGPQRANLLSGIARCGKCGAGLICTTDGEGRRVYRCRKGTGKGHVARDAAALEDAITRLVIGRLSKPDARQLVQPKTDTGLARLRRERTTLQTLMRESNGLRRQGLLSSAEFAEERAEHQKRLARLDAQIAAAEETDVLAPMLADPARAWETRTLEQRRAVISALMTVTIMPQRKGRPKGWRPGLPYFDPDTVAVDWKR